MAMGKNSGFTLLELIVAITILAIITSFIYGVYTGSVRTIEYTEEKMELYDKGRLVLERMSSELRSTAAPLEEDYAPDISFFYGTSDKMKGKDADEVEFVTRTNIANYRQNGRPVLTRIRYFLERERDREGKKKKDAFVVIRSEDPIFHREFTEDVREEEFVDGCSGLDFQYYGESGWVDEWDDQDETDQEGKIPRAVKISLTMKTKSGDETTMTTIVDLPCGW